MRHATFVLAALAMLLLSSISLTAQTRDVRGERIVVDDNSADGVLNTMIIRTPNPLGQNVVLTIPDPGAAAAEFLLAAPGTPGAWLLGGNAGTTAGTNFLGTTDAVALHLYVNSGTDNGLILNTNGSLQRDNAGNARGADAVDLQINRAAATQVASSFTSTISGGSNNTASQTGATVGGGSGNTASNISATVSGGSGNTASNTSATVGGGVNNNATGNSSVIAGGGLNAASTDYATVGGGQSNNVSGAFSTISGGRNNVVAGVGSAIPGGRGLTLDGSATRSFGFLGANSGSNDMTVSTPNVVVFGNTDMWLANNDNAASQLRFYEAFNTAGAFPSTANYTAFQAGVQAGDITYTLPTADGSNGQVLSTDGSGVLSWITAGGGSLTNFTESINVAAPNATIPVAQLLATNAAANVDAAFTPKGTGAVLAQVPDNAVAGGNKRGTNAVDWQTDRAVATEVASGTSSTVSGGAENTASGTLAAVGGGGQNVAGGNFSAIPGGVGLTLSGSGSFGFLGNNIGSNNMTISATNVSVLANTDLWLANNDDGASAIRFYERNNTASGAFPPGGINYVSFEAGTMASDDSYTLPNATPATGVGNLGNGIMESTNAGLMSWRGMATATAALDFPNTPNGSANDLTITVTGAVVGDIVSLGVPHAALVSGADQNEHFSAWVSAANTVTVRFHNDSGSPANPGSQTFAVMVIRP